MQIENKGSSTILKTKTKPWWEKSKTPFKGEIFSKFNLQSNDEEENRIQSLRQKLITYSKGKISTQRAKLITESYKQTEGEQPAIRKAKAFLHIMKNISIEFLDEELIVGNPNSGFGTVEIDPEYMADWLNETITLNGKQTTELRALRIREHNRIKIDDAAIKYLEKEIFPYWNGKTIQAYFIKDLKKKHPKAMEFINYSQVAKPVIGKGFSHTLQDYNYVLKNGLISAKKQIQEKLNEINKKQKKTPSDQKRIDIYESMIICAEAVIIYAKRCASKADELSRQENDISRKKELEEIAEICNKVPEKPAETWWEALQSLNFLHLSTYLAEGGVSHAVGRLDQYLYPFLQKDIEDKLITNKKAQELLECFFIKFYEFQTIRDLRSSRGLSGDRTNDKITISGVNSSGEDATNELSYMILEAFAHVHLKEPNISVRVHRHTSRKFLMNVLEIVRLGSGMPIPLNDEVIIPSLTGECGVSLKDARNYADLGCQENIIDPNTAIGSDCNGHNNAGWFNLPKIIELTLNNGINPSNGKQIGPKTGDPSTFSSMDEFLAAFQQQLDYAIEMNVKANLVVESCFKKYYPTVFHNLMHPNTRKDGLDYNEGGCKYNWIGAIGVGIANAGDSLTNIDRGIFTDKQFTWNQLLSALKNNWKGYENIRKNCLQYPKYGADNDEADKWVRKLTEMFIDTYGKYKTDRGGKFVSGFFTMGMYLILGEETGATPDGRKKYEMLANSICGSQYAPKLGPTAAHKSSAKLDTMRTPNGITFNSVLSRSVVSTERDLAKWAALLRTYLDYGGQTVQYSIVDKQEMLNAQKEPEKYHDLIVRVGGYSAVFTDLTKEIQDDIIERSYEWH